MKQCRFASRILSLSLALTLVLTAWNVPVWAEETKELQLEQVENSLIEDRLIIGEAAKEQPSDAAYEDSDIVRVSLVLEGASVLDAGYSSSEISENEGAKQHLKKVKENQKNAADKIAKKIGKPLKVKHNLAVAANIISAEIEFGDIAKIEEVAEVKAVIPENRYLPCLTADAPQMAISVNYMTGASQAWAEGYTGAGSRVAIIDTGLDIDHQSFDDDAFLYAIEQICETETELPEESEEPVEDEPSSEKQKKDKKDKQDKQDKDKQGKDKQDKEKQDKEKQDKDKKDKDKQNNGNGSHKKDDADGAEDGKLPAGCDWLLDQDEIAEVLPYLNAYAMSGDTLSAADVSISAKIPFGFNYIDRNTNVTHLKDTQGEHGSHVAGIAAANRYIKAEEGYAEALGTVGVAGNAPDAQILVMKVFGQGGGAYDSDYMAAIEDALLLNCDAVNLSLGSSSAGMTMSAVYQHLLDQLSASDTVVVMSAGNSGAWAENTSYGELYADGVNYDMTGSPASFTNSLAVASAENVGIFGCTFDIAGKEYTYTESGGYSNRPLAELAGEQAYVFLPGFGEEADYDGIDVEGKIVFCSRGSITFSEKANNAAARGAIAMIIYNNQPGSISMDLSEYSYDAPCVSILQAAGENIRMASTEMNGGAFYTGTITIGNEPHVVLGDPELITISDFSSWGVPGDLSMKPEITAPGGNIWSVNGSNHAGGGIDQYELMSGTSMAAPQITGMSAVLMKYVKEKNLPADFSDRAAVQSLLMSTAVPEKDADGYYYSVLSQGAGLANVADAMRAATLIRMDEASCAAASDGKVKAELGDDPERTGSYQVGFSLYNITDQAVTYQLDADVFTQYSDGDFVYGDTDAVDADVSFSTGDTVTVPAGGSAEVTVSIELTEEAKAALDADHPAGSYLEAYIFAEPTDGSAAHSIPVLGYYGSWTDPSMFDLGSSLAYQYGLEERMPYLYEENGTNGNAYLVKPAGESDSYYFGSNLYAEEEVYHPEYASLNSTRGDEISRINYALIRNAGNVAVSVSDHRTGEQYFCKEQGSQEGAFYYTNGSRWMNTASRFPLNWTGTDRTGEPLADGTKVDIRLMAVPEYYCAADGSFDCSELGDGAFFSTTLTIDNTAPVLTAVSDENDGTLSVSVSDNVAVAALLLYAQNGRELIRRETVGGPEVSCLMGTDLEDDIYLIAAIDYAGNQSVYKVYMNVEATDTVERVTLNQDKLVLMKNSSAKLTAMVDPVTVSEDRVSWSTDHEDVAVVNADGVVTAVGVGECVITAASVLDPEKTASCEVEVLAIEKTLNGVVWDENGQVWLSELNTAKLPAYHTLVNWNAPINGLAYGADGTLYASDLDMENEISNLYIVDSSMDLSPVGTSSICYTELAEAPSLGEQLLLASYYNYIVVVDGASGDYIGAFDYCSNGDIVGIAYAGSMYHSEYEQNIDLYYLLDSEGNLYFEAFICLEGSYYYFAGEEDALVENTGITCDTPYFQSMYFDGEYTFVSCYNEAQNSVTLYAVDTEDSGVVYELGSFADGVWPVAALSELGITDKTSARGEMFGGNTYELHECNGSN